MLMHVVVLGAEEKMREKSKQFLLYKQFHVSWG